MKNMQMKRRKQQLLTTKLVRITVFFKNLKPNNTTITEH